MHPSTTHSTTTEFPLSGPINLLVRLGHGTVTVTARDDLTAATVRLTPHDSASDILERIAVEMRGPTLFVVAPRQGGLPDLIAGRRPLRDSVDADIEVPSGTALEIKTASADITVNGRCGGADIATGSGGVVLDRVDGDLRMRYGSSGSRVQTVTGDITVRSGSGDARIGATCADVDFVSGSGSLTVGLPTGMTTRLDVVTGSGRVHSDLPIEGSPAAGQQTITVRARTGSGDVRLLRAP